MLKIQSRPHRGGFNRGNCRRGLIMLTLVLLASPLSGCGVKPSEVEAPPGDQGRQFPHPYPAPDDR